MIEQNRFVTKTQKFCPLETFQFIIRIFEQQAKVQQSTISLEVVHNLLIPPSASPDPYIQVHDNFSGTLPEKLLGDHIRLKQVLVNLIKNALKFSYKKWVQIKVCYNTYSQQLVVHVVDDGRGIKETEIENLFRLFGKLDEHDADRPVNSEGIGMGLYICKQIVDNTGG